MAQIKVSDYIFHRLADWGVRHVFLVTGGGAMHLNDSLGGETRIHYVCNHHEQASAIAAEAYARVSGAPGVINVTTGPGGINALNGVFGAWTDSIPMLILSGQVKRQTCMATYPDLHLRQLGDQEVDIVRMAGGITKYAVLVDDPRTIRYHLERAWYLTTAGRPGPCWLDIPIDVQSSMIEADDLPAYDPAEDAIPRELERVRQQCREVLDRLRAAKRPVLLVGTGVRVAGAEAQFTEVIRKLGIPVTTAWTAHDLIATDDPLYCGRPSTVGDRPGNFTVQNADALLVLGCRLHVRQISYNWENFARDAYVMQVDVDPAELAKPTVTPDLAIQSDLRDFLTILAEEAEANSLDPAQHAGWLAWCKERVARYPALLARQTSTPGRLNPYEFVDQLFRRLHARDVIACGDGTACVVPFQVGHLLAGQRMFTNAGAASMGYDLPAAIGAAFARPGERIICLAGDGSVQMNLQELQTVVHHHLPIKLFILNNRGYLSIRSTQKNFFGRYTGSGLESGLSFPDMVALGNAYGIPSLRLDQPDYGDQLTALLAADGPALVEVMLDPDQEFEPRTSSKILPDGRMVSAPLEDMYPFLGEDELRENMLVQE